ncbi:MAG: polyprenyl synthetase family protein [Actinobacteria bacterium]|nr:polyprenyl synthetase family protein [Actinomycetota bacterium]
MRVQRDLTQFLTDQTTYLGEIGIELIPVAEAINSFLLDGGKRLRPLFAYCGYLAAGGEEDESVIAAVASLELLQACALIHDDLMDNSDTRRGRPSIHRWFEGIHVNEDLSGSAIQYGSSAAILLGDLALVWSDQMLHQSGISAEALMRALSIHDEMRVELMAGQFLDIHEQALATQSVARSLKIARYKSGKYTIERPLHLGASLAIGDNTKRENFTAIFSEYGLPLGEAFQLRDDLLGVFGDPATTGKPAGDDLREGKRTVLMAMTQDRATEAQEKVIAKHFGTADLDLEGVNQMQQVIVDTGAKDHVEQLIDKLTLTALDALDREEITTVSRELLQELADIAVRRAG